LPHTWNNGKEIIGDNPKIIQIVTAPYHLQLKIFQKANVIDLSHFSNKRFISRDKHRLGLIGDGQVRGVIKSNPMFFHPLKTLARYIGGKTYTSDLEVEDVNYISLP